MARRGVACHPAALPRAVRQSDSGMPVGGVDVSMRDIADHTTISGSDITNRQGVFRITGLSGEDFGMKVNGSAKGFETGWLACANTVVHGWPEACGAPLGRAGKVRLDKL